MPDQTLPVDPSVNTAPGVGSDMPSFLNSPADTPTLSTTSDTMPPQENDIPPKISNMGAPKGGGKILATIFGILFLVGAVGVGVKLLGQRQLLNQKAATCSPSQIYCGCTSTTCCINACVEIASAPTGCNTYINAHCPGPTQVPSGGTCSNTGSDDGCTGRSPGDTYCSPLTGGDGTPLLRTCYFISPGTSNHMCGNTIGSACNSPTPNPTSTPTPTNTPTPTPTKTPTPSPSPSPVPPVCLNVKVYDTSWTQLTQTQLNALQPGAIIRFTALGSPTIQITQANFTVNATINGANQQTVSGPVTIKKPNTNEFYFEYTIKTGTTGISASAKLYSTIIGWF